MSSTQKFRSVQKIIERPPAHWEGKAFHVYQVFHDDAFTEEVSPFLLFDYAAPKDFPPRPGEAPLGVKQHPHRGFETVTVAFQGEVEHHDSTGKTGVVKEGDVQWMTAGRGIIHEEYHSKNFTENGGTFEMCQLWVNLPKTYKMTSPGYQPISKCDIPVINLPLGSDNENCNATARIIAGELGSTKGAAKTFSPIQLWDVNIPASGSVIEIPFPETQNCIVFMRRGKATILNSDGSSSELNPPDVALMKRDGSTQLRLHVHEDNSSVLVLGGEPLNEPIAADGPFVMNTHEEVGKAYFDYRSGNLVH